MSTFYEEIENAVREQELKKRRKLIRDLKKVAVYFGFFQEMPTHASYSREGYRRKEGARREEFLLNPVQRCSPCWCQILRNTLFLQRSAAIAQQKTR